MHDIVERLRGTKRYTSGFVPDTLEDAAKEIERLRRQIDEPPVPDGAIRAHLYLDKCTSGLWFVTSKEWRGMYLAHRDLGAVLADVPNAGKGLLDAMKGWIDQGEEPLYGPEQLEQLAIYERFFGDMPQPSADIATPTNGT